MDVFTQQKRIRRIHSQRTLDVVRSVGDIFGEIGVQDFRIVEQFCEPPQTPIYQDEIIYPDLLVVYLSPAWNILWVEVKARHTLSSIRSLDERLEHLRGLVASGDFDCHTHHMLNGKIPLEIIKSAGVHTAGVYGTKRGGFRIYRTERLRESYFDLSSKPRN
jgi:hypothetical protein